MNRKQMLREEFEKAYGKSPEAVLGDDYQPSERDLEIAVAMDRDNLTSIAVIIQAEETLRDIDDEHLSDGSKEDIRSTEAQLRFSKKVEMARYGMQWKEIRDLFLSGQYDVLDERYSDGWDAEDLARWETEEYRQKTGEED